MSQSSLPSEILKLSIPQRVHLVEQIWDSIVDEEHSFELSEAQKKELDRRIDDHNEDPTSGTSWENLKQKLRGN